MGSASTGIHSTPWSEATGNTRASMVVAVYHCASFVQETLASALAQDYSNLEIVIINDGSTDGSWDIVERLVQGDPRVKILRNAVNRGQAFTYNRGVRAAEGEYLTFLDCDDLYDPGYTSAVVAWMEEKQADIAFANLRAIVGEQKTDYTLYGPNYLPGMSAPFMGQTYPTDDPAQQRRWILQGQTVAPRAYYRRSLFDRYGYDQENLRIAGDWLRHLRFILSGAKVAYLPTPLGAYRFHPGGQSQKDPIRVTLEQIRVLETVEREFRPSLTPEEVGILQAAKKSLRQNYFGTLAGSDLSLVHVARYLMQELMPEQL